MRTFKYRFHIAPALAGLLLGGPSLACEPPVGFVNPPRPDIAPLELALWAIPTAVAAFLIHSARLVIFDRKLGRRGDPQAMAVVCAAVAWRRRVPFKPTGTSPVYCGNCFDARARSRRRPVSAGMHAP